MIAQGWALATCGGRGFAVLGIDRFEQRRVAEIDDGLAVIEGLQTGPELQQVLLRFYPDLVSEDQVTVLHFHLLRLGRKL